jgi:hypothetical protein
VLGVTKPLRIRARRLTSLLTLVTAALVITAAVVKADTGPYGQVIVPGNAWAGQWANYGDLNVYGNGAGGGSGTFQCTDIAARWANVRYGEPMVWHSNAAGWWDRGPNMPIPFEQHPNGGPDLPQFGDLLVFGATSYDPTGHIAVVTGMTPGYVQIVEQNWGPTGMASLPINGTTMPTRWGLTILGWLRAQNQGPDGVWQQSTSGPGGYQLDGYGGVHPFGSAIPAVTTGSWPGWNIARGIARNPSHNSGYVLDGYGGLHPWAGSGVAMPDAPAGGPYWGGWDIARAVQLLPNSYTSGYVLDGWGGLHPFGSAPPVNITAYWPGWDIAKTFVINPDGQSGYVMDGYGGLHPFGTDDAHTPTGIVDGPYWGGWDIARSVTLLPGVAGQGYVLDAYGGLHNFGGAPGIAMSGYFAGHDVARGVWMVNDHQAYVGLATGITIGAGTAPSVLSDLPGQPNGRGIV